MSLVVVLHVSPGQEARIARAIRKPGGVLRIDFGNEGTMGKFVLDEESAAAAADGGASSFSLEFTSEQVRENIAMPGSYLSLLNALWATHVPTAAAFQYLLTPNGGKFRVKSTTAGGILIKKYNGSIPYGAPPGLYNNRWKCLKSRNKIINALI